MPNILEIIFSGVNKTDAAAASVKKNLDGISSSAKGVGASMDVAMGVLASTQLQRFSDAMKGFVSDIANEAVDYAKQVEDLSRLSGSTVEDASRIIQVADDMRIEYGSLTSALKLYAKSQADAGQASQLSIDTLARLSDEYLKLAPGIDRTNFLLKNFGRGGLEMGRLMEQGGAGIREMSGAVSDSLVMTQEGIDKANDYYKALDDWQDAIKGVKLQLAEVLMPYLTKLTAWMTEKGIPLLEKFVEGFEKMPEPLRVAIIGLGGLVIALTILAPAILAFTSLWPLLSGVVAGVVGFITSSLIPALVGIAAAAATVSAPVIALVFLIGVLLGVIVTFGPQAWAVFKGLVDLWLTIVVAGFKRMVSEIKAWLNKWIQDFRTAVKFFADIGKNIVTYLWNGIKTAWTTLKTNVATSLKALISLSPADWATVGRAIVDGIWKGIQSAWTTLKTNWLNLIKGLLTSTKTSIQSGSPSELWAKEVGLPMAQGVMVGFQRGMRLATPAISGSLTPSSALSTAGGGHISGGSSVVNVYGELSPEAQRRMRRQAEDIAYNAVRITSRRRR